MISKEDFLKEEIRSGYTISAGMKKIWAYQLELLEHVKKVCDKYGLQFWLDSGTLLGAIRHKGYIPWDDDIDIVMFRKDYDKLVKVSKKEFRKPFIFQTAYNSKHYVRGHAQVRNANTTAILPGEIYKDFNQGIFIDIFVMDFVPANTMKLQERDVQAYRLREKLERIATPLHYCKANYKTVIKCIWDAIVYPKCRFNRIYKEYDDIFRNCTEETDQIATSSWLITAKKRNAHAYDETVYADFEYLRMPIPAGYDEILQLFYGDYMTPVKAPSAHGEVIFDTATPACRKIRQLRKDKRS